MAARTADRTRDARVAAALRARGTGDACPGDPELAGLLRGRDGPSSGSHGLGSADDHAGCETRRLHAGASTGAAGSGDAGTGSSTPAAGAQACAACFGRPGARAAIGASVTCPGRARPVGPACPAHLGADAAVEHTRTLGPQTRWPCPRLGSRLGAQGSTCI